MVSWCRTWYAPSWYFRVQEWRHVAYELVELGQETFTHGIFQHRTSQTIRLGLAEPRRDDAWADWPGK
jgi:hypothetical protein